MKVLHFYRTYFPYSQGGAEEAIRQICASTQTHGVQSRVLTLTPAPDPVVIKRPEADVYQAKLDIEIASCSMGYQTFGMFRELAKWADVINYHFPWPFADIVKLVSGVQTPSIITYHSDIVRQRRLGRLYRPLMESFLGSANCIVATSPDYLSSSSVLQKFADNVEVIPLGLDETHYPAPSPELLKNVEHEYGNDFFLFIGVLRQYKGLPTLIEALVGAPYKAVIAGIGPEETALKSQAKSLGLSNVIFPGYISDEVKIALLTLCRGVVLPSCLRSEAFGMFLLEGAMLGKPLISADIGTGTSYINIDGETGLVVAPNSFVSLRAAMDHLYRDAEAAAAMGAKARQRFTKLFTAEQMGRHYAELYNRVAKIVSPSISRTALSDRCL